MNAFFRFFFPSWGLSPSAPVHEEITAQEAKQRDTVLALLSRLDTARRVRVDPDRDVIIFWDLVTMILFRGRTMVTVDGATFEVPHENCPEAKAARDALYLKGMSDVCEKALRATEPT